MQKDTIRHHVSLFINPLNTMCSSVALLHHTRICWIIRAGRLASTEIDRQTGRQAGGQTGRQVGGQAGRQAHRQVAAVTADCS